MKHTIFIRNVQARDQLELFIVSGISSLLLLRYFLYLTGYPQVGGGSLHIAHMLYGGLLMMAGIILQLAFLGRRIQRFSAFIGGVGFGIFIDEIGKFLTRDNNYFFRPAIGIIYAVFALLYLASVVLTKPGRLTSKEYQLNTLVQLEEAVLKEMDQREKTAAAALLARADPASPITRQLGLFLSNAPAFAAKEPNLVQRCAYAIARLYGRVRIRRSSSLLVQLLFITVTVAFLVGVLIPIAHNIAAVHDFLNGTASYGRSLIIGQLASTILAGSLVITGIVQLKDSLLNGFEWFRRSVLVNLLLTEFFIFSRVQFAAMAGFIITLLLLLGINLLIGLERRTPTAS